MVDLLARAGFNVSSLPSMIGVTNHLIERRVSVVVLDVMMPTIRGDKLATLLRKEPGPAAPRRVRISGLPEHEVAPLMAQVGVDAFVSKANLRTELAATVARVVALKKVHAWARSRRRGNAVRLEVAFPRLSAALPAHEVKGVALLARKNVVRKYFGRPAWDSLWEDMAKVYPCFRRSFSRPAWCRWRSSGRTASSFDVIIETSERLFTTLGSNQRGGRSPEGPYKGFVADRDSAGFATFFPRTWGTYFVETTSRCTTHTGADNVIQFRAFDLPQWHPYLEYFIVGYYKGGWSSSCKPTHEAREWRAGTATTRGRPRAWSGG